MQTEARMRTPESPSTKRSGSQIPARVTTPSHSPLHDDIPIALVAFWPKLKDTVVWVISNKERSFLIGQLVYF
jgi:hypothetical protein